MNIRSYIDLLITGKKRRNSFNLEAQKQAEFEKQQFEMLKKKKKER